MSRLLLIPLLALCLAACQSPRTATDYDPARNFAAYSHWSWQDPAVRYRPEDPRVQGDLTDQRIRDAVAQALDQRGLRPATATAPANLRVQAWLVVDQRQEQMITHYGGTWGYPWRSAYWGYPGFAESRTIDYQVATLQVDLYDAGDGKLVWRGASSWVVSDPGGPLARGEQFQRKAAEALTGYPPQ